MQLRDMPAHSESTLQQLDAMINKYVCLRLPGGVPCCGTELCSAVRQQSCCSLQTHGRHLISVRNPEEVGRDRQVPPHEQVGSSVHWMVLGAMLGMGVCAQRGRGWARGAHGEGQASGVARGHEVPAPPHLMTVCFARARQVPTGHPPWWQHHWRNDC